MPQVNEFRIFVASPRNETLDFSTRGPTLLRKRTTSVRAKCVAGYAVSQPTERVLKRGTAKQVKLVPELTFAAYCSAGDVQCWRIRTPPVHVEKGNQIRPL